MPGVLPGPVRATTLRGPRKSRSPIIVFGQAQKRERHGKAKGARHLPQEARLRADRRAERAERGRRRRSGCASSSRSTTRRGCTTTCGSSSTACSSPGRSRAAPRSIRPTSASPSRSRTIRSTTAISRARSPRVSMAAARCNCGIAATGRPRAAIDPTAALAAGELKFTLDGERLHGSWVLVRMKHDQDGGKRTNWLLIKHRDAYAHEPATPTRCSRRIARSPRGARWRQIAAGKGRGPKPFMLAGSGSGDPAAVWDQPRPALCGRQARQAARRPSRPRRRGASRARRPRRPISSRRNCASLVERPPNGRRLGATKSNSTAIACNCASRAAARR